MARRRFGREEPYCRPPFWLTEWPPGPGRAHINAWYHRLLVRRQPVALELRCASYALPKRGILLLSFSLTCCNL